MKLLVNKKARYEYAVDSTYTAGIVLTGAEVKSLRLKHGSLAGSFVKIIDGELFLINAQINPYAFADTREYDPKRTRKLLMRKKELVKLASLLDQKKATLIPLSVETVGRTIKLVFGVAKALKKHEKRTKLKDRDLKRAAEREASNFSK